jgi:solute carrier family 25 carnitine/acylcarnitine transporter 20/29
MATATWATSPGVVDTTIHQLDLTEHCVSPSNPYTLDRRVVFNSIAAGSVAGMLSCSLFHPFDVLRTKMQMLVHTESGTTTTALEIIRKTIRSGGLYTGLSLPLAAQAIYKATIFTSNEITRSTLIELRTQANRKRGNCTPYPLSLLDYFVCGATSGAINALLFVSPVEYIRNQLIVQHSLAADMITMHGVSKQMHYKQSPVDVIRNTYQKYGLGGLWRGSLLTIARDSLGCGGFFLLYEVGQIYIPFLTGRNRGDLINAIGSGFLAGFGFWSLALPLDSLKTMVQTGVAESSHDALGQLLRKYGSVGTVKQLYRGWQFGFGRGSPSAAVTLTAYAYVYEYCTKVFE